MKNNRNRFNQFFAGHMAHVMGVPHAGHVVANVISTGPQGVKAKSGDRVYKLGHQNRQNLVHGLDYNGSPDFRPCFRAKWPEVGEKIVIAVAKGKYPCWVTQREINRFYGLDEAGFTRRVVMNDTGRVVWTGFVRGLEGFVLHRNCQVQERLPRTGLWSRVENHDLRKIKGLRFDRTPLDLPPSRSEDNRISLSGYFSGLKKELGLATG